MNKQQYISAAERYLSALPSTNKSAVTVSSYRMILDKFAAYMSSCGMADGAEISLDTVIGWRENLAESAAINTVRHYMMVLHGFFTWAKKVRLVGENPVDLDEVPKQREIEYQLLTLGEIERLLSSDAPSEINRKTALRNRAMIVMLIQTGMRNAELRGLRLSDIDFAKRTITLKNGKGGKSRTVPFPELSRIAVTDYLNSEVRPMWCTENDLLFGSDADENGKTTNGAAWHEFSSIGLLQMVNRYIEKVTGRKGIGVHALRHAAASLWDEKGVPMRDIQNALGHNDIRTTQQIYVSVLNKSKSAERINAVFDEMA